MAATLNVTTPSMPRRLLTISDILGASKARPPAGIIAAIPTIIIAGPVFNWFLPQGLPQVYQNIDISVLGDYKRIQA